MSATTTPFHTTPTPVAAEVATVDPTSPSSPANRLELLSKLYASDEDVPNLQYIYQHQCTIFSCRPNSDILRLLPGGAGGGGRMDLLRLRSLDLSGNVVGRVGMLPILYTLTNAPGLEQLSLADNFLSNETVLTFVELFRRHPSLRTIDLSGNPISQIAGKALLKYVHSNPTCALVLLDRTLINKGLIRRIQGLATAHNTNRVSDGATTYFSSRLKELLFDARVEEDARERLELDTQQSSDRQLLHLQEGREYSDIGIRESTSMRKVRDGERVRAQEAVIDAEGYVRSTTVEEETHGIHTLGCLQSTSLLQVRCEMEEEPMGRVGTVEEEGVEWNGILVHTKEAFDNVEKARKAAAELAEQEAVIDAKEAAAENIATTDTEKPTEFVIKPLELHPVAKTTSPYDDEVVLSARGVGGIAETVAGGLDTSSPSDANPTEDANPATVTTSTKPIETKSLEITNPSAETKHDDDVVLSARGVRGIAATVADGLDTSSPVTTVQNVATKSTAVSKPDESNITGDTQPPGLTKNAEAARSADDEVVLSARGVGGIAETVADGLDTMEHSNANPTENAKLVTATEGNKPDKISSLGVAKAAAEVTTTDAPTKPGQPVSTLAEPEDVKVLDTADEANGISTPVGVSKPVEGSSSAADGEIVLSAREVSGRVTTVATGLDTFNKPATTMDNMSSQPKPANTHTAGISTDDDDDDDVIQSTHYLGGIPKTIASGIDMGWLASRGSIAISVHSGFSYTTVSSRLVNDSQSSEYDPYDEL